MEPTKEQSVRPKEMQERETEEPPPFLWSLDKLRAVPEKTVVRSFFHSPGSAEIHAKPLFWFIAWMFATLTGICLFSNDIQKAIATKEEMEREYTSQRIKWHELLSQEQEYFLQKDKYLERQANRRSNEHKELSQRHEQQRQEAGQSRDPELYMKLVDQQKHEFDELEKQHKEQRRKEYELQRPVRVPRLITRPAVRSEPKEEAEPVRSWPGQRWFNQTLVGLATQRRGSPKCWGTPRQPSVKEVSKSKKLRTVPSDVDSDRQTTPEVSTDLRKSQSKYSADQRLRICWICTFPLEEVVSQFAVPIWVLKLRTDSRVYS